MDLFDIGSTRDNLMNAPLAYRMRPRNLDEIAGQQHIVGPDAPLRKSIEKDELHSFVLYGPPGTGKTSIATVIARMTRSHFEHLLAVGSGVSEIRKIAADAIDRLKYYQQKTILFLDEVHRFNKSQQDVLLSFVEEGTLVLIGATTENPLYELNNALLSRIKLYVLEPLKEQDIRQVIMRAVCDKERGLGDLDVKIEEKSIALITRVCKGDARLALNILETAVNSCLEGSRLVITPELLQKVAGKPVVKYDRAGDCHYDTVSAFIKSIRGSDPDAALYWLAVMLEGGEDPRFIARRLIIHAAEDIGLADPYALTMASSAAHAVEFVGLPEARIPLAEATIYLATAPKSNSSKVAIDKAIGAVRRARNIAVPPHIADASHSRAGLLGKGRGYKYPHDYGGYVKQKYLPDEVLGSTFYMPGSNGYEKKIKQFLSGIKKKLEE
ncbi:MAG: replication-associated recombination protein A [Syntrophomonadaceae bacterium]|nr:replication-associated recombination protein A [Syntrophomonadaceae bacterium]